MELHHIVVTLTHKDDGTSTGHIVSNYGEVLPITIFDTDSETYPTFVKAVEAKVTWALAYDNLPTLTVKAYESPRIAGIDPKAVPNTRDRGVVTVYELEFEV